jgi:hypothetical protein
MGSDGPAGDGGRALLNAFSDDSDDETLQVYREGKIKQQQLRAAREGKALQVYRERKIKQQQRRAAR